MKTVHIYAIVNSRISEWDFFDLWYLINQRQRFFYFDLHNVIRRRKVESVNLRMYADNRFSFGDCADYPYPAEEAQRMLEDVESDLQDLVAEYLEHNNEKEKELAE